MDSRCFAHLQLPDSSCLVSGSVIRLSSPPVSILETLSTATVRRLLELEEQVLLDGKKCADISHSFVSSPPLVSFPPQRF